MQYSIGNVSIRISDELIQEDDIIEQKIEDQEEQAAEGETLVDEQEKILEARASACLGLEEKPDEELPPFVHEICGGENRSFYGVEIKKSFRSSECDLYQSLLHQMVNEPQKKEFDLLLSSNRYPFLYHLSEERGFVTEVMGLDKNSSVLEIGAECGAVTGALLRRAGTVDCICSHERHATINALRNLSCSYSIYVGPIETLEIEKKYDVVTLIGSLSYASRYSQSGQPFSALLHFAVDHLAPGGRLYIATENTIGMKFLAGAAYDYRAEAFTNLQYPSYSTESSPYRTFTKSQLIAMLAREGLDANYFYYPYPDYKFPALLYSDDMYMEPSFVNPGKEFQFRRFSFFNESMAYIILNGTEEIKTLANSFLVEAWKSV